MAEAVQEARAAGAPTSPSAQPPFANRSMPDKRGAKTKKDAIEAVVGADTTLH